MMIWRNAAVSCALLKCTSPGLRLLKVGLIPGDHANGETPQILEEEDRMYWKMDKCEMGTTSQHHFKPAVVNQPFIMEDRTPEAQATKAQMDKWDCIKLKSFIQQRKQSAVKGNL